MRGFPLAKNHELQHLCDLIDQMGGKVIELENIASAARVVYDAMVAAKNDYLESIGEPPKAA